MLRVWLRHFEDDCCHWTQRLRVHCWSNSQEGLAVTDTDSLYELQQSVNDKLSDIAKYHTCVSPGKNTWNEDQATGCQGNLSWPCVQRAQKKPAWQTAAGNKGKEDFEILWITLKVTLQTEVSTLKEAVVSENERVRGMLEMNCMQLSEFTLTAKDEEVARLKGSLHACTLMAIPAPTLLQLSQL